MISEVRVMPEKEDVIIRLQSLGYDINEGDGVTLENAIRETVHYIKAYCNIKEIPKELYDTAVDMAAGRLLRDKLATGSGVCGNIDFDDEGIKSLTEGDVSVTFSDSSGKTSRYENLIARLCNKNDVLICYRRVRW